MPNQTWQEIQARGQQSLGVWGVFAPSFTVAGLTHALHSADVVALPVKAQAAENQQDALDAARAVRDGTANLLRDLGVRVPRRMDGELSPSDPMHGDLEDIRAIEMTGLDSILGRGQRVHSTWTLINAHRAAATPALPAVVVGGTTAAQFATALTALPAQAQLVEDARALLKEKRSELRTLVNKVDSNNKRWYAAWQGEYAAGTPEGDALSQIDTGSPGGGSSSSSSSSSSSGPTVPAVPENLTLTPGAEGSGLLAVSWDASPGATSYKVRQGPPGPEQTVVGEFSTTSTELSFSAGQEVTLTVSALNSAGESAQSDPVNGTAG